MADTELIDAYYEEHSVYKSLVICDDEATAIELATALRAKDYTLSCIMDDDITDDRPKYMRVLEDFGPSTDRMLVMTYFVWCQTSPFCKAYVLPHQNLVVFYNLDHNMSHAIANWLQESEMCGFLENCNILSV